MRASTTLCVLIFVSALVSTGAFAQDAVQQSGTAKTDDSAAKSKEPANEGARAGMFLPFTEAPRTDSARAYASAQGGYDGARDSALLEGRAELTVWGPIALRIGTLYTQHPEQLRPSAGARVQALQQGDHGIDFSVGAFYKPEGFTEGEGEIEGVLAFGRSFGHVGLFADLVYGQDPEGRERDGEVRAAVLYSLGRRWLLGFDSRVRLDLGSEEDKLEEEGGAEYDVLAAPTVSLALGDVALGAHAGVSVLGTPKAQVGALALLTLSGAI